MRVSTFLVYVFTGLLSAQGAVTFTWLTVGDAGNANDPSDGDSGTGGIQNYGQVNDIYRISAHEVTNAQYAEFLNSVDPTGANANLGGGDGTLYNSSMDSDARGGITLNGGNANGSKYEVKSGQGQNPVVYTSFYDAMRFNNWLHNGQGSGSTESGAYDLSTPTGLETRESGATYFIPSENEWYKAAYYDPGSGPGDNYWLYPTQSDTQPTSEAPAGGANSVNYRDGTYAVTGSAGFNSSQNYLTDVGLIRMLRAIMEALILLATCGSGMMPSLVRPAVCGAGPGAATRATCVRRAGSTTAPRPRAPASGFESQVLLLPQQAPLNLIRFVNALWPWPGAEYSYAECRGPGPRPKGVSSSERFAVLIPIRSRLVARIVVKPHCFPGVPQGGTVSWRG